MEMEMKKMDRLSELPDSLILNVFEFLEMKDIVKTQILSHRWEKLWTLTPYLYFDNDNTNSGDLDKFRNLVHQSLSNWRGEKIQKFKIRIHKFDASLFGDMDFWVRFAVDNGVEELDTSFLKLKFAKDDDYLVPECLYSSPSLRKLSVFGSLTNNSGYGMQWKQLKILKLGCFWMTQHSIDQVLSGIPVLEEFFLALYRREQKNNLSLSFRSTSLKKLVVSKIRNSVSGDTELRIWTPNLKTLSISGGAYGGCSLMDVSSLTHATLSYQDLRLSELVGATTSNGVLSTVVCLNLNGSFEGYGQLVGFLEFFPKLKMLVLGEDFDPKSKMDFKQNSSMSMSFLVELRKVEVTCNMRDFSIFPLIEMLLNYASKLETMVFRAKQTVPPPGSSDTLWALVKLLRMKRSSPTAELIFSPF